jgi:hypothetical protein
MAGRTLVISRTIAIWYVRCGTFSGNAGRGAGIKCILQPFMVVEENIRMGVYKKVGGH